MPFVQDVNQTSRNFATLGILVLDPPFTSYFISCYTHVLLSFQCWAGVRKYTYSCELAFSCVFNKQSQPFFLCHPKGYPFFRRYRVNLPSSFKMISSNDIADYLPFHQSRFQVQLQARSCFQELLFYPFSIVRREKRQRKSSSSS